jgi:hypothetical protein
VDAIDCTLILVVQNFYASANWKASMRFDPNLQTMPFGASSNSVNRSEFLGGSTS